MSGEDGRKAYMGACSALPLFNVAIRTYIQAVMAVEICTSVSELCVDVLIYVCGSISRVL